MYLLYLIGSWLIVSFWGIWLVTGWFVSGISSAASEQKKSLLYPLHFLIVAFAVVVNIIIMPTFLGGSRIVPRLPLIGVIGFLFVLFGILLAFWSRLALGSYWSSVIRCYPGQPIVKSGPYHLIRHPIYTGVLLSTLGMFLLHPQLIGLIGLALMAVSYTYKLLQEEKFLLAHYGNEYRIYMHHSYRLLPWVF